MATYTEIRNLMDDSDLRNKIATAAIVAAEGILNEATPTNARVKWASSAFENPQREANRLMMAVLASNRALTVAQISGASDTDIQTAVNSAINLFIQADSV